MTVLSIRIAARRRSLRELEYREQSRFEELTSFGEGGWRGLLASE